MAEAPLTDPAPRPDRGRFGPVVLAGLATAGLAALVSTRDWYDLGRGGAGGSGPTLAGGVAASTPEAGYPAATAVALLLLASWGVLLVTRRRVRRAFAVIAVVASVLLVAATVVAGFDRPAFPGDIIQPSLPSPEPPLTTWYWVGAVLALLSVPPALLAVRLCPRWPEMGSRYDAPASRPRADADAGPGSERELWRSLDEGQDPTDD